uniref:SPRY-domain-containing protein n=1 Tax=Rhizophagus irregularis (strain DAOM 181602 / DAOM 197198 / MUCL 43194) TaxID=747089 RepID=U9TJ85_RHIID
MTNTSSNSISSRRNIFNSATAAQLALMSNSSSSSTYPMSNPPPAMLSQISAPYYRPTITTYPLTSTSYASGSSTRASYYNNLSTSSTVTSNTSSKQSKLKTQKPKLPEYLADTSFAELYYNNSNTEKSQFDKDPLENLELPTAWNVDDKCTHLSVDPDKLRVNYIGSGKNDIDAAAIRANHPMPPQCGLFYFEVDVISKGKDGFIGIGFCSKIVPLNRLPVILLLLIGWENDSWGYHGDDGHSFCCSGTGKPYGPTFTTGDTIGCCLNFRDGTAFYTKNGKHLGIAFRDLKGDLYPSIGLRTQGESVEVNFGNRNFKYAIEHYMKEEKARLWHAINAKPMPPISSPLTSLPISQAASETNLTATVHQLIVSYLVHHGYSETAKAFSTDAVQLASGDSSEMEGVESENSSLDSDKDMINRQRIRDAVLKGEIDFAIKLTNTFYPSVLPSNGDILFQLRCRKFIEMMGLCAGSQITCSDDDDDEVVKVGKDHLMLEEDDDDEIEDKVVDDDVDIGEVVDDDLEEEDDEDEEREEAEEEEGDDEYADAMEAMDAMDVDDYQSDHESVEEVDGSVTLIKTKKTSKRRKGVETELNGLDGMIEAAMRFGQELQDDYRDDNREEIKKALEETFSLLAYTDPRNSVVSYLLDPSGREPVANALNSAILVSQGKPPIPPLERVYRQSSVVLNELARNGVGSSAFVNLPYVNRVFQYAKLLFIFVILGDFGHGWLTQFVIFKFKLRFGMKFYYINVE